MKKILFILSLIILITFIPVCKKEKTEKKEKVTINNEVKMAYEGYLMDAMCGIPGVGLDGTDVANSPQDHTKHCLEYCIESGYGIYVKNNDKYQFIEFDQKGHDLAVKLLENSKKENTFQIIAEGIIIDDILNVESLTEKEN